MKCALCGRYTSKPAAMIGDQAVGPTCARRAGLLAVKPKAGSAVRILNHKPRKTDDESGRTLDLFEGLE